MSERTRRPRRAQTQPAQQPIRPTPSRKRIVVGNPTRQVVTERTQWRKQRLSSASLPFTLRLPRVQFVPDKVVALVLLLACVIGMFQLGNHDMFYVYVLSIEGNAIVPQTEIESASGVMNWNVFFIEPIVVESALKRLPEVKHAHV